MANWERITREMRNLNIAAAVGCIGIGSEVSTDLMGMGLNFTAFAVAFGAAHEYLYGPQVDEQPNQQATEDLV